MAEEKTVRISRKAMLEKSIAKQRERLDKYIDLCADGIMSLWSMFCLTRSVRRVEKKLKEEEEYRNMERVDGEVVEDTDLTDRW